MAQKKPFHEAVAEKLIEQLKAGTAPWQRPWEPGGQSTGMPSNPTTGKRYKGINAIQLMSENREDNRWLTYKQASSIGAQVRRGEKGTPVQYWKFSEEQIKRDENGKPVIGEDGKPEKEIIKLERPRVFMATVFNAEQIDGMPPLERKEKSLTWNTQERAEKILESSGANIFHSDSNRAFYRSSTDSIHLPEKNQFDSAEKYYAVALHELGHWTGHASRLDRDMDNPFGSEAYAKEELRAEISSMILGEELGIGHDTEQHAAYVGSWIKALQDDPLEIFRAAADAEKIHDFVLGLENQQTLDKTLNTKALDYLARNYGVNQLDEEQIEFLNRSASEGLAPVLGAIYLAEKYNLKLTEEGLAFSVTDRLIFYQDDLKKDQALTFLDAGTGEKQGQHKYLFNASDSEYKHVIGINHREDTAEVLQTIHKESNQDVEPSRKQFIKDILALPVTTQRSTKINQHINSFDQNPEITAALDIDINNVLNNPDVTFDHFRSFKGDSLESALRERGFNSIGSVTGSNPGEFNETARERLSPVFGISPHHDDADNEYLERKGLAQQFAIQAEEIYLTQKETLNNSMEVPAMTHRAGSQENPNSIVVKPVESTPGQSMLNDKELQKRIKEEEQRIGSQELSQNTYINVPYKEKEEAKGLGAKWDRREQSWYVPGNVDLEKFAKWRKTPKPSQQNASSSNGERNTLEKQKTYLAVPYAERGIAKSAGALWDKKAKSWYVGPNGDMSKLNRWLPKNIGNEQSPALTPVDEFKDALVSIGCLVTGDHPIMDGKPQRIEAIGDKKGGEKAGFYIGHLDGHPAGYIKNNRTGEEMKWKSKGYALSEQEKANLAASAAAKLAERDEKRQATYAATAQRVKSNMANLKPISAPTPYHDSKGIKVLPGALTDDHGKTMFIPAQDTEGKIWAMQYINEDGTKRFAKDGKKEGCFHVVGGMEALSKAPALVVGEGYATASTASEALGFATVSAFDSGNLPAVVVALHEKFPDKNVLVIGDDDRHLEMTQGKNPGREKAESAAKAAGGKAIFPIFMAKEIQYPNSLPPVTPQAFRDKQLSSSQESALARIKKYTDFNDMANKSNLGLDGVKRQLNAALSLSNKKVLPEVEKLIQTQKLNKKKSLSEGNTHNKKRAKL